jgi:hypothetical protein
MDKCEISENINKIINELQKINSKCEGKIKNEINSVIETSNKIKIKTEDKQTSTEEKRVEEVRAGYMGVQINRSNNRWISSLRNPFSIYMN